METTAVSTELDPVEAAFRTASAVADELQEKLLDAYYTTQRNLSQRDRSRRRAKKPDAHEVVNSVLNGAGLEVDSAECLVIGLMKTMEPHLATEVVDWLLANEPQIGGTEEVLHAALTAAATCFRDPDVALRFYQLRESYGLSPSIEAANMAITACSHFGRVATALKLLRGMKEQGLTPTFYSVLLVVQAANYKGRGMYEEAVQAVQCLPRQPSIPSTIADALLTVFETAMRKAGDLGKVQHIFAVLKELRMADSTRAYNALLKACAARGDWKVAIFHFEQMAAEDVPADISTLNSLIAACLKGGALSEALSVFEWLVSGRDVLDAIPADTVTYNTLIKACHQAGLLEKALEIATWVTYAGVPWDHNTYEELISTVEVAQLWDAKVLSNCTHEFKFARQMPMQYNTNSSPSAIKTLGGGSDAQQAPSGMTRIPSGSLSSRGQAGGEYDTSSGMEPSASSASNATLRMQMRLQARLNSKSAGHPGFSVSSTPTAAASQSSPNTQPATATSPSSTQYQQQQQQQFNQHSIGQYGTAGGPLDAEGGGGGGGGPPAGSSPSRVMFSHPLSRAASAASRPTSVDSTLSSPGMDVKDLALFPHQLRPAPFDGLRLLYMDHRKELQQESLLAAVKLGCESWAARTLTSSFETGNKQVLDTLKTGGSVFTSSSKPSPGGTGSKKSKKGVPRLPRIHSPPQPVALSPAPTCRHLGTDPSTVGKKGAPGGLSGVSLFHDTSLLLSPGPLSVTARSPSALGAASPGLFSAHSHLSKLPMKKPIWEADDSVKLPSTNTDISADGGGAGTVQTPLAVPM